MTLLKNKNILISGGSRGIGEGIVRMALNEGANVAFLYQNSSTKADVLVDELSTLYSEQKCQSYQCDVASEQACLVALKAIEKEFGEIDILVNNAGIARDANLARMQKDQWDNVLSTNLGGVFNLTKPLILNMVKKRKGVIINLSSIVGLYGATGQTCYATSKAGIIGFTKALSKELAMFGVRVNAIAPGFIESDMLSQVNDDRLQKMIARIPSGRLGTSEDVANLVCFLASDRAQYITGQVIQVDGGISF